MENVINKVGQLLKPRENRCRGWFGKTADGRNGLPTSRNPNVCRYCVYGALIKVTDGNETVDDSTDLAKAMGVDYYDISKTWDKASDEEQDAIVEKLLAFPG